MTFPVLSAGTSAYNLTNSLRFRAIASAYLNRTLTSNTNRRISTTSMWVKLGSSTGSSQTLLSAAANGSSSLDLVGFTAANEFQVLLDGGATGVRTTQVFRDPSAWYHLVFSIDTAQATASNRIKVYVNGVQVTALSIAAYPAQNYDPNINSAIIHNFARQTNAANYFDGYMAEVNFIDGQALTPSSFGSTNAVTGVWQPAKYTGTYGTNGFYLPFTNTTSTTTLGNDFSGNGNNWTTNNISLTSGVTYDSMTDVPTLTSPTAANYSTLNPLDVTYGTTAVNVLSNGNLTATETAAAQGLSASTIKFTSGKWYVEFTASTLSATTSAQYVGFRDVNNAAAYYAANGTVSGVSGSSGGAWSAGDIIGVAVDKDNGTIEFFKNNTTQGGSRTITTNAAGNAYLQISNYNGGVVHANFGQRPFAYTPPSGFVALNTFNLPSSTIPAGNQYMDATLYTGTGSSLSVTNSGAMQPGLVWIKSRSAATNNKLTDVVRGVTKALISNTFGDETTDTQGLTAFGSAGFTVGTDTTYNNSGATYVGWQWRAGGAGVTNTSGTITSTVSVNTTSGFSVIKYISNGVNGATVGHGLGVAPSLVIVKCTFATTTQAWAVYHSSLGATQYLILQTTDAAATSSTYWNNTAPTSSVFTIGTSNDVNINGSVFTYAAYCFAPIAGFSAFGSYTANGSATDGPFVYLGFRPRFVMIKGYTGASSDSTRWLMLDSSRDPDNATKYWLYANLSNAEVTLPYVDFLSNGFKLRDNNLHINQSGISYIYAAFAENPFKNALAR